MRFLTFLLLFFTSMSFSQSSFYDVGESVVEWDLIGSFGLHNNSVNIYSLGIGYTSTSKTDVGASFGFTSGHSGDKGKSINLGVRHQLLKEYYNSPIGLTFDTTLGSIFGGNGIDDSPRLNIGLTLYKSSLKLGTREREIYMYTSSGYTLTSARNEDGVFIAGGLGLNVPSSRGSYLVLFSFANKFYGDGEDPKTFQLSISRLLTKTKGE